MQNAHDYIMVFGLAT